MTFSPDWTVHPGELIVEMRVEAGISQVDLAERAKITPKHLCRVEKGRVALTARVAVKIEAALGVRCAETLVAMQAHHDVFHERRLTRAGVSTNG